MSGLFHTRRAAGRAPSARRARAAPGRRRVTLGALIARSAARLRRARVFFGHGSDNAWDEAATLVLHALRLPLRGGTSRYARRLGVRAQRSAHQLVSRRIRERLPSAYLTGVAWFAGVRLRVDPRVLVPRSPLAELIERGFAPWIDPRRVRRVLDVGTGSGCIAIGCARVLPGARVDAVEISDAALEVARANVRRLRLQRRVRLLKSDHFSALGRATYDIIVANPPYVGSRELAGLPPEYRHEPRLALAAGRSGLDSVRVILREAARHLRRRGLLIVEVGNTERAVRRAWPRLPFVWLEFARGGGGVFLLTREQLQRRCGATRS
ncbi:MAG TPA: 50S ribosomal protein L3 N(5)-glutamine methyltransferase [Steroidobacteraceae bacterium]|nr:50S ribosomal protein L3 N(5)-glutamine methyltransferase [Steroidobacteraceae bacterium]